MAELREIPVTIAFDKERPIGCLRIDDSLIPAAIEAGARFELAYLKRPDGTVFITEVSLCSVATPRGCPKVGDHYHSREEILTFFGRSRAWLHNQIHQGAPVAKSGLIHCYDFHAWLRLNKSVQK